MEADRFLASATDPEEWWRKSVDLRLSADRLWDRFFKSLLRWAEECRNEGQNDSESHEREALAHLTAAKLLYGLALETAFKAYLLEHRPGEIEFRMSADGTGQIQEVEVKHFGVPIGAGHDLDKLAEKVGLFSREGGVFSLESDFHAIREILQHLSEVVSWSGRYPVPRRSGISHAIPPDLPAKIFGHYIRDWTDQVLDHYQGNHWPTRVLDS